MVSYPKAQQKAVKIANEIFDDLNIIPGMTEKDVARQIRIIIKKHGGQKESFRLIIASGKRSKIPHGFATDKIIKKGEVVKVDCGALYQKYRSDITRTFVLGKPSKEQLKVYNILLEAQSAAVQKIKAGASCKMIDNFARTIIEEAGYGKYFKHSTGHGIGTKTHEQPRISRKSKKYLKAGDVITIEPGIYLRDWGMRVEDMFLVTKNGYKQLTDVPRSLKLR